MLAVAIGKSPSAIIMAFTITSNQSTRPGYKLAQQRRRILKPCNRAPLPHCPLTALARPGRSAVRRVAAAEVLEAVPVRLDSVIADFQQAGSDQQRLKLLQQYAQQLDAFPEDLRTFENRVMGCTTQVWVKAELDSNGRVQLRGDSDSQLTRGLCAVLVKLLSGLRPAELLQVEAETLASLGIGPAVLTPSRNNGFLNMLEAVKKRARLLTEDLPRFPSLLISADEVMPQGRFAEAQAEFLQPDPTQVDALVQVLKAKQIGVVAHFYMDPQVQGVLTSARQKWPHIHISDSLVMADSAVKMAEAGCTAIAVLGVDFMSENVRAILDEAGHKDVKVYRMAAEEIGCSLAEAAESPAYDDYLRQAASDGHPGLHVIYINTSLRTKALAHASVPTITCTSSNVVNTVLQGFAQVPDLRVWYGPDTYMGRNLAQLFTSLAGMSNEEIAAVHPGHNQESIRSLLPRLHYFDHGTCIVHHMFGAETTALVRKAYSDALLTAHFEVPGEMFTLAMEAKARGRGVVGSTSNILDFITENVSSALEQPFVEPLQVVLGTESGMITAIVRKVQQMLQNAGNHDLQVEIVFPVAPDAMVSEQTATLSGSEVTLPGGLAIIPGAASGEGCSTEGGCASCPYMKMNTLQALLSICAKINTPGEVLLERYRPREYTEQVAGRSMAAVGCEPILHMRGFQKSGGLPDSLVADIMGRKMAVVP